MRNLSSKNKKLLKKYSSKIGGSGESRISFYMSSKPSSMSRKSGISRQPSISSPGKKRWPQPQRKSMFIPNFGSGQKAVNVGFKRDAQKVINNQVRSNKLKFKYGVDNNNVKDIHYTQTDCSHSFSDGKGRLLPDITTTLQTIKNILSVPHKPHNMTVIIKKCKKQMPHIELFFTLEVIPKGGTLYSCNNRRLCLLKTLVRLNLFDGNINTIPIQSCSHGVIYNKNDILINTGMGHVRCNNLYIT